MSEPRLITRPFLLVGMATLAFFVYVGILNPVMPRLVEHGFGGNEVDIGINLAAFSAAAVCARPVIAWFGDRFGLRALMMTGSVIAGLAILASTACNALWQLVVLRACAGVGEAGLFVGGATAISNMAPSHRRAEAASYFSIAVFGGLGIGPVIGETVLGADHYDRSLVVAAGFAFVAAACCLAIPASAPRPHDPGRPPARRGFVNRTALRPGLVLGLSAAAFATFNAFMPEHARDLGMSGSKWVFAEYSIICLLLRVAFARLPERIGLVRSVAGSLVAMAIGLLAVGTWSSPAGVYGGVVWIALGMTFVYPALMALTINAVPEHERTSAMATFTMFFEIGIAAGGLTFGGVAQLTSKSGAFVGGSVAAMLGLVVLWKVIVPWRRSRPISASQEPVELAH